MLTLLYLCEASSEHPLAKAIVQRVKEEYKNVETDAKFKLSKFKNINGEGVVASIAKRNSNIKESSSMDYASRSSEVIQLTEQPLKKVRVICGNDKLMDRHRVDLDFNNFRMNM